MSEDKSESDAPKAEILAPERSGALQDSDRPMVISAINRVRNRVIKKELDSFAAKIGSWNAVVSALRESERLRVEYQASLVRSENLPMLRIGEEAKIYAEVQKIFADAQKASDEEADRQRDRAIRNIRGEAELIRAQRELEALQTPPNTKPEEKRSAKRVGAMKRIREERDEMIALIMEGRPEDQLTGEDRQLVNDIRLAAENEIKNMLEERA